MSVEPRIKANQCIFVLYPETQQDIIEYVQSQFSCAWILHDRDVWLEEDIEKWERKNPEQPCPYVVGEVKKEHVHFVCTFLFGRYFHAVAKELGIPSNTIRRCNNLLKAYEYLFHKNDPEKYQYTEEEVGMNDFVVPLANGCGRSEEELQVELLLAMPRFDDTYSAARWAFENGCWAAFRRGYQIWRDIRNETKMEEKWRK